MKITNKTKIDAKFIIKSYQSMDKDEVEHYIQFKTKPETTCHLEDGDNLFYFERNSCSSYNSEFPIGMGVIFLTIEGVYHKWLICRKEKCKSVSKISCLVPGKL